jgi:hypothetical protein
VWHSGCTIQAEVHAMKRITILGLVLPLVLAAQDADKPRAYSGSGYLFAVAGACQHGYAFAGGGGGAEALVWKGLTVGAEGSYQSFSDGWGFGIGTAQVGYHFMGKNRAAKWDPFVTYGMGMATSGGGFGRAGNLGGGGTYWFKDRVGLRMEGRVQAFSEEAMFAFRVGLSFR